MLKASGFEVAYDVAAERQLAADAGGTKNFFGPYPWWVTIGKKA